MTANQDMIIARYEREFGSQQSDDQPVREQRHWYASAQPSLKWLAPKEVRELSRGAEIWNATGRPTAPPPSEERNSGAMAHEITRAAALTRRIMESLANVPATGLSVSPATGLTGKSILKMMADDGSLDGADFDDRLSIDCDYLARRLLRILSPRQARIWLTSENRTAGGRPLDVLILRGASDVIAALDVEENQAFG